MYSHFLCTNTHLNILDLSHLTTHRGLVNAKAAYDLLADGGCVAAGGAYPANGQPLSSMAQGGKNQVETVPTATPTPAPTFTPCPSSTQKRLQVEIATDSYPSETTWTVTNKCSSDNQVIMSGGTYPTAHTDYSQDICAENGQYEFKINVSYFHTQHLIVLRERCNY